MSKDDSTAIGTNAKLLNLGGTLGQNPTVMTSVWLKVNFWKT